MTKTVAPIVIDWYRTPLEPAEFRSLHRRSDALGFLQTLGYLGLLTLTGAAVLYAAGRAPVWVVLLLIFLHGTCFAFQINAVHELGHGTVFKTRAINEFFVRIFAFLGWINFEMFNKSHLRHHRFTLHQPDDLEVVLPLKVLVRDFFLRGLIDPRAALWSLKGTWKTAGGKFDGEWMKSLFAPGEPERKAAMRWARILLVGHASIFIFALYFHLWLLPVVTTAATWYGGWLFFLCNNTQHIGLQDDVPDFRLCCRTFTLNPVVQFLYWHMNYHTEHHMYAAVPCYRLPQLHRLIKHDLPPCPRGIVATWREIAEIQRLQNADPAYQHVALVPVGRDHSAFGSAAISVPASSTEI
jgi:fatty acid desaturase